jgi:stress-induced morphogen
MPISAVSLENAIKNALPVVHLEIQDESDGCGDKFSVVIVSEVRFF